MKVIISQRYDTDTIPYDADLGYCFVVCECAVRCNDSVRIAGDPGCFLSLPYVKGNLLEDP